MSVGLLLPLITCFGFGAATTSTYCGEDENFCVGEKINFQCNITGYFLEWTVPRYELELDFSSIDNIGFNESGHGFTAALTGKAEAGLMSIITFKLQHKHNNTNVTCLDGTTGQQQTCSIFIETPGQVINLKKHENELSWDMPLDNGGEKISHYMVCDTESNICWNTDNQSILLNLTNGEYNFSVKAVNCQGAGDPVFILVRVSNYLVLIVASSVGGAALIIGVIIIFSIIILFYKKCYCTRMSDTEIDRTGTSYHIIEELSPVHKNA